MRRKVGRAAILLLASLAIGGCSMVFPLDLVVRDGKLLFWTEREWRWFFIPHRPTAKMCAVDVWSGRQWVWRIEGIGASCLENALPVTYGAAVPGTKVIVAPQPLRRNTDYVVRLTSWETGWKRFSINDAGIVSSEDAWGERTPRIRRARKPTPGTSASFGRRASRTSRLIGFWIGAGRNTVNQLRR